MDADFSEPGQTRDPETYAIIGAAMEVHRELRHGLVEPVYQDGLEVEFSALGIPFNREKLLKVLDKGRPLASFFKADFVCYESIIVECQSQASIGAVEDAQVINYLRISGLERAVLLNFGAPSLPYKRLVLSNK